MKNKKRNMAKETMLRLLGNKFFLVGGIITFILVFLALISPLIIVHDPEVSQLSNRLIPPQGVSAGWHGHILGTDPLGRDVLTRLQIGSRTSFYIAFTAVAVSSVAGVVLGIIAAYYGSFVDNIIMRIGDIQLSIPQMMLAVAVVAVLGTEINNLILVLIVTSWVQYARVVRSNVMVTRKMEFVSASKVLGASDRWIMFRQIFPNVLTPLLILISQQVGFMILVEAGLSFLGLGVQPPAPSWGVLLADGKDYLQIAPWVIVIPGIFLAIAVLGFNFIGDGLRDALDPKMR